MPLLGGQQFTLNALVDKLALYPEQANHKNIKCTKPPTDIMEIRHWLARNHSVSISGIFVFGREYSGFWKQNATCFMQSYNISLVFKEGKHLQDVLGKLRLLC